MKRAAVLILLLLVPIFLANLFPRNNDELKSIIVKWNDEKASGNIRVLNGKLTGLSILEGKGKTNYDSYLFSSTGPNSLNIKLDEIKTDPGSNPTLISVTNGEHSFSFFLRDVSCEYPIYIPEYNVIISISSDKRTYKQIESEILSRKTTTKTDRIENEIEESFDSAAVHTRNQKCPILLGIGRDVRVFELGIPGEMEMISPKMCSSDLNLPEMNNTSADYCFLAGRGQGVVQEEKRWLDEDIIPVYHKMIKDDDILYSITAFASFESSLLTGKEKYGSHFLVADNYSYGHTFTEKQKSELEVLLKEESDKPEEAVLFLKTEAVNLSSVPCYAYFRTLRPGSGWWEKYNYLYDNKTGLSSYSSDRVFGISKLNGHPLPDEEISVLLRPGEKAVFEFFLPHKPISKERAVKLSAQSFESRLADCREFWKTKLLNTAQLNLPENRINEMVKAGLLHLDLVTYGLEPDGILAACPGVYSPIGSESSPIIQFFCSMGLFDQAKRSLRFFLEKQYDDGMISSFGGYMIETGAVLYTIGEYFRYTRDTTWIKSINEKLIKSCDYLINWRNRSKKPDLIGRGYGMIDGKVADPNDPYHQFMLNGYGYLGLKRMAEVFGYIDEAVSKKYNSEADAWRKDIRESFFKAMGGSPVVPAGDGTWCPTVPPWTEAKAPRLLYFTPETFLSHGTFTVSDVLLGPLYLIFCEVLDPMEPVSKFLMKYHSELFYQRNAAFSQPYYSRHNFVQLKQEKIKPFLKTYYNTVAALADRETYTFWEHLYHVSIHKTHEEAWFLMETRWMIYMEEGETLKLLSGVPRNWLQNAKTIEINNAASYFGPVSFIVKSELNRGIISAKIKCNSTRMPKQVIIRIPHPENKNPVKITGGTFNKAKETVTINNFTGTADITIEY